MVLGLDPGFASLGWALLTPAGQVINLGVVRTKKSNAKARTMATEDNVRRARELAKALHGLLDGVVPGQAPSYQHVPLGMHRAPLHRVVLVCAEAMSFPRSASVAAKMAMTWGALIGMLEVRGVALLQGSPQEVKRRCTGKPTASKDEVQRAMVRRYGPGLKRMLKGIPADQHEHAYDALASATACLETDEARMLRAGD